MAVVLTVLIYRFLLNYFSQKYHCFWLLLKLSNPILRSKNILNHQVQTGHNQVLKQSGHNLVLIQIVLTQNGYHQTQTGREIQAKIMSLVFSNSYYCFPAIAESVIVSGDYISFCEHTYFYVLKFCHILGICTLYSLFLFYPHLKLFSHVCWLILRNFRVDLLF